MTYSIIFIGKYDENLHSLEEDAINMQENSNQIADRITLETTDIPDVKRYKIKHFGCDVWTIIGDVKPTLLLKKLLFEANLIIFYFDRAMNNSLNFLKEGWGPIINKVLLLNPKNQKRILIASQSKLFNPSPDYEQQISKLKSDFRCDTLFKEDKNSHSISKCLINYLKQSLNNEIEIEGEIKVDNNINYKLFKKNKKAEIIKSPDANGKIVIKNNFDSCKITHICEYAFAYTNIELVDFLCNDCEIGENAFKNCKFLTKLNFNYTNTIIFDNNCFDSVEKLSSFKIKCSEITLKKKCFNNCSSLNEFSCIESKKIAIFPDSFSNCTNLWKIELISDSIYADFSSIDIQSLTSFCLTIKKQSVTFKKSDFQKCQSLKKLDIICYCSIKIETASFNNFKKLEHIYIMAENSIEINNNCFNENHSIKSVKIKAPFVKIGDFSFNGLNNYKSFSIKCHKFKISDNCRIKEKNIKKELDSDSDSRHESDSNSNDYEDYYYDDDSDSNSNDNENYYDDESEKYDKSNDDKSNDDKSNDDKSNDDKSNDDKSNDDKKYDDQSDSDEVLIV